MATSEKTFKEIKNRDAWSTLRGFVYQVDLTILRWMNLKEDQILELEKWEDIDIVSKNIKQNEVSRELEQVKYREVSISLNQEAALELLLNFFLHKRNNPDQKLIFRYVTNANYAIERPALFPSGQGGIEVWTKLFTAKNISSDDVRVVVIKNHLLKKIDELIGKASNVPRDQSEKNTRITNPTNETEQNYFSKERWTDFKEYLSDNQNLLDFIKDFEWSLRNDNSVTMGEKIKQKLLKDFAIANLDDAEIFYSRFFLFVFKLLTTKSTKTLKKTDLIVQLTLTSLTESDKNLLKTIQYLLENFQERMQALETKVSESSVQVANLIHKVTTIEKSDTIFNYRLKNLSINPPALIKGGSMRGKKVLTIVDLFQQYYWINFQGINGTGKSQLAALVCIKYQYFSWIDLRAYNRNPEQTTLLIETFLANISNCEIEADRNLWIEKVVAAIPAKLLLVFNDLPKVEKNSGLSDLLIRLVKNLPRNNVRLLTTSNYSVVDNVLELIDKDIFHEYSSFEFTDEEINEYLTNSGANDDVLKFSKWIASVAHRNPSLVSAIVFRLRSLNWGQDTLMELLLNKEFTTEILQDAQQSITNFITDDDSRELLYRLSLIQWSLKLNQIISISNVEKSIVHPNEKLQSLINLWIQQYGDDYNISPLIYDIGKNNLPQIVI